MFESLPALIVVLFVFVFGTIAVLCITLHALFALLLDHWKKSQEAILDFVKSEVRAEQEFVNEMNSMDPANDAPPPGFEEVALDPAFVDKALPDFNSIQPGLRLTNPMEDECECGQCNTDEEDDEEDDDPEQTPHQAP